MFGMTFALVWTSGHEFLHVRSWICGGFINLLVNSAQHVANLTILDILGWPTALARHPTRHPDYFHSHMCATGRMPKGVSQGLWGPPCCFSARMKNIPLWMGFDEDQLWFRRCAMTTAGSWKYHQHTLVEISKHRPQTATFLGLPCFFSGVFCLESAVSSVSSFCLSGVGAYYGFEGGWCSWFFRTKMRLNASS